jgi:hypothetical protein
MSYEGKWNRGKEINEQSLHYVEPLIFDSTVQYGRTGKYLRGVSHKPARVKSVA